MDQNKMRDHGYLWAGPTELMLRILKLAQGSIGEPKKNKKQKQEALPALCLECCHLLCAWQGDQQDGDSAYPCVLLI